MSVVAMTKRLKAKLPHTCFSWTENNLGNPFKISENNADGVRSLRRPHVKSKP